MRGTGRAADGPTQAEAAKQYWAETQAMEQAEAELAAADEGALEALADVGRARGLRGVEQVGLDLAGAHVHARCKKPILATLQC